jgi:polysaccharide biosynthesis protein PslG
MVNRRLRWRRFSLSLAAVAAALVTSGSALATTQPLWSMTWVGLLSPVQQVAGGVNLSSSIEQSFASLPPIEEESLMRQVRATGATWIRIAMPMPGDEYSPGNFTWYSDTEVKAALAAGLHVDGLIGWPASWALNADGSPNMGDWATFAEAVAKHYSAMGVRTFEIWNEPNTNTQWATGVNIPAYANLLRTIYPVIKANDPGDNVMVGGLAPVGDSTDGSSHSYSPLTFLTELYKDGAGGNFDSVGFHPYSYPNLPAQSVNWNPWTYLPQVHALMNDHGDGAKRVWFTEFGAPIAGNTNAMSLDDQGRSYSQAFAIARGWAWSGPVFAYNWVDWDGDGSGYFGLHTLSGQARPALWYFERAIVSKLTLYSTKLVPTVQWAGSLKLSSTLPPSLAQTFSWTVNPTSSEAPTYEGWSEAVDGQAVSWNRTSTVPSGSINAATLGVGTHTVIISLYFSDGSMCEVLSPLIVVTG